MLYAYWKDYDYAVNYYIFHLFFTIAAQKYPDEWEKIPKLNNLNPHVLQWEFAKKNDEARLKILCRLADFHKLTYRLEQSCNDKSSFYDVMINQGRHLASIEFDGGYNIEGVDNSGNPTKGI